eukprot:158490-Rhodomonas_salina.1
MGPDPELNKKAHANRYQACREIKPEKPPNPYSLGQESGESERLNRESRAVCVRQGGACV